MPISSLKSHHDLREIVTQDLGSADYHGERASQWICPFHSEQVDCHLLVWSEGFQCFGACAIQGGALDWLRRYRRVSLQEAVKVLDVNVSSDLPSPMPAQFVSPVAPSQLWQDQVRQLLEVAQETLWSEAGEGAVTYLQERGLTAATIRSAQLGLIVGDSHTWQDLFGLRVPAGILIPSIASEQVWLLKVRRADGQPKYIQVAGGNSYGLYNADAISPDKPIVFCEGEFDTLLLQQEAEDLVTAVTLASATATLSEQWHEKIQTVPAICMAYDNDISGRKGAATLQSVLPQALNLTIPHGKDITEFYLAGGDLHELICHIPERMSHA